MEGNVVFISIYVFLMLCICLFAQEMKRQQFQAVSAFWLKPWMPGS